MTRARLVPDDFVVPLALETSEFRLRPLLIGDVVKDYEAVMTSVEHLKGLMSPGSDWPVDLTFEDDLIDLGWHHKEFRRRTSFAFTVMSLDESRCLGCCYIYPASDPAHDAEAYYWARQSELAGGLEERLGVAFRDWLARDWPFKRVAFPGR
ncbi:MAG: hypothetical protein R3D57_02005 [Hyphomicrobiaceae bacterium]